MSSGTVVRVSGIFLATVLVGACGGQPPTAPVNAAPVAVRTITVVPEAVNLTTTVVGTLEPEARVVVAAQEEGLITAVKVREGDRVHAGQVVVELDDRRIQAELAEAEARREDAQAQWRRAQALVEGGLISEAEADAIRSGFQMAAARVDVLRTRVSFTRITAPVDGVVTARHVEVGNLAAPRSPLLEMAAGSGLLLRLPVSELDVVKLAPGDRVEVRVDALGETALSGRIARIYPAADTTSRQVTVEVALPQAPAAVRPGFLARASLVLERRERAILVPEVAVVRGAEVPFFVWVVKGDQVEVRPVKVAARLSGRALVEAGLEAGDEVVVEGLGRVRPGATIQRMGSRGGA